MADTQEGKEAAELRPSSRLSQVVTQQRTGGDGSILQARPPSSQGSVLGGALLRTRGGSMSHRMSELPPEATENTRKDLRQALTTHIPRRVDGTWGVS